MVCWEGVDIEERNGGEERMGINKMGNKIGMGGEMAIGKEWG